MVTNNKFFNTLFWKISGVFLVFTIVLGLIFLFISVRFSGAYNQEAQQRINRDIAAGAVKEVSPIFINGGINEEAIHKLMSSMMAVNPSIEVYLLDNEGKILTYVVPGEDVKAEYVSLGPVKEFLSSEGGKIIKGDDPRNPDNRKIFSAAPVVEEGLQKGYLYIILASNEYTSVMAALGNSYILKLGFTTFLITLVFTLILGLFAIWVITRNLNTIISVVEKFKKGDLSARIEVKSRGELANVANTFNDMADKIEKNIEQLKGVEELRKELIANISHDLRNPIASIQGFAETILIKNDSLPEDERKKYLEIILHNSENLSRLVNDLFELSKLETNPHIIEPEPLQIAELVQDVSDKFRLVAKEKNININTIYSKSLPLVYADIQMTDRVFQNLLDNAVKYCNPGGVITIELELQEDSVLVKVSDTGKGIAQEDLPYIFTRYYRGSKTGEKNGTGLGLAIVKKILDLHKSVIKVYSRLNYGTRFEFNLPIYLKATI